MSAEARPTQRGSWPPVGTAHRRLLEIFDELREAAPRRPSYRDIAERARSEHGSTWSHSTVDRHLRGVSVPQRADDLRALVLTLGGGRDDLDQALSEWELIGRDTAPGHVERCPRTVAPDRDALAPRVLPLMPRAGAVGRLAGGRDASAITVLTGDGGLGKSVLLGQLLDRIERLDDDVPWSGGVFLSCAALPDIRSVTGADDVDRALGLATGRDSDGALALARDVRTAHGRTLLALDTLDVLLTDDSATAVASFLARATEVCDVLVTCRRFEYDNYLGLPEQSAPQLSGRIAEVAMPDLNAREIVDWARAYLAAVGDPASTAARGFLNSLQQGVSSRSSLRDVCSVPVRLALTCAVFSEQGQVPDDLTVTELYQRYWNARVQRHNGVAGSATARSKERAALAVAGRVVVDRRLRLHIPRGHVRDDHDAGVDLLISEGVLRERGPSVEFFHQTFAEFAHARAVLDGTGDLAGVVAGVVDGNRNLWPVLRSLLLQVEPEEEYERLSEAVPHHDPEGARTHVLAALRRPDPATLASALARAAVSAECAAAVLPLLTGSPRQSLGPAVDFALTQLRTRPEQLAGAATAALARLLGTVDDGTLGGLIASALDAVLEVRPRVPRTAWSQHPATVLAPFVPGGLPPHVLASVWTRYRRLDSAAQQSALRIFMIDPGDDTARATCAAVALRAKCPGLDDEDSATALELLWESAEVRLAWGWTTWSTFLGSELPPGWINGQIRLALRWSRNDVSRVDELVRGLVDGDIPVTAALVNVLKRLVPDHASRIADMLVQSAPPSSAVHGAVADCSSEFVAALTADERNDLVAWLDRAHDAPPRSAWPARIVFTHDDLARQRDLIRVLGEADVPDAVIASAVDTWINVLSGVDLTALAPDLRAIMRGDRTAVLRARLESLLIGSDPAAETWIYDRLLNYPSSTAARSAARATLRALAETSIDHDRAVWLAGLLATRNTDAARNVAESLADREFLSDSVLVDAVAPDRVLERMGRAVDRAEDGDLTLKLAVLLIRIDRLRALSAAQVETMVATNRGRLPTRLGDLANSGTDDHSGAVRLFQRLSGTVVASRLTADRAWELVEDLLRDLDPAHLGSTMPKALSSILVGMFQRDDRTLDRAEALFAAGVSDGVRWAIADAMLVCERASGSPRARRLRMHPSCRGSALTHLLDKLPVE